MPTNKLEQNKRTVMTFFERFNSGDIAGAYGMFVEGATMWVPTDRRERAIPEYARDVANYIAQMTERLHFEISTVTAEDDRVAVMCESHARLNNGNEYNNVYHFLFRVADDRILQAWEFLDTAHVYAQTIGLTGFERFQR